MILGPSVLELSSGNHLVDRPTDRPTCAKQYTPSSLKGRHKNDAFKEIKSLAKSSFGK